MEKQMKKILLLLACSSCFSALQFTTAPALVPNGSGQWQVTFSINDTADVEVAVVDTAAGVIVRHLAAGKLGANPPAPLQAGTLAQTLVWDGLDDFGRTVANAALCGVRVRAGMDVRLDNTLRPRDGCHFAHNDLGVATLAVANGCLYAFGNITGIHYGRLSPHTLRRFAVEGDSLRYISTLYPSPANLGVSQVSPFGIIERGNGAFSPEFSWLTVLSTGGDIFSTIQSAILPFGVSGSIMATLPLTTYGKSRLIGPDGSAGMGFNLLTSPAMPDLNNDLVPDFAGTAYYSITPDSQFLYLSGVFGGLDGNPMDTGFWRDGGVFKVNRLTGAATRWLSTDPVPNAYTDSLRRANVQWYYPCVTGTCADSRGRVFVCDRLHRRIGVYDSSANLLDTIALPFADRVIVDEPTNSIYVLTANNPSQSSDGAVYILKKFHDWPANRAPVWTKALPGMGYITNFEMRPSVVVMPSDGRNMIAVAVHNILLYRDDDTALTLVRNYGVNREAVPDNGSFDRPLFVNRATETVYFGNSMDRLYRVADWDHPEARPCTTSEGEELKALDATISPDNRFLYSVQPWQVGRFSGGLGRFTTDARPAPVDYANVDTNIICPTVVGRLGAGIVLGGLGVHPGDNRVAVIPDITWTVGYPTYEPGGPEGGLYDVTKVFLYADSGRMIGANGEFADTLFEIKPGGTGGGILSSPRFDLQGNLYVGCAIWNFNNYTTNPFPNHIPPAGYEDDNAYQWGKTCIARIPAGARSTVDFNNALTDLELTNNGRFYYSQVMMQSGHNTGFCNCRSGSFDVDYYGRLFVPNAVTGQVTIMDNNDNVIKTFGEYGNVDSWGPESPIPGPGIPLQTPVAAAASDNYVYVADQLNTRLTRVKMVYELDNLGQFQSGADKGPVRAGAAEAICVSPNPCNPVSRISFRLGQRANVELAIYTPGGRLVKTIAAGRYEAGTHSFVWNARESATGLYLARLRAGNMALTEKVILAK